jgi:hypothetical protein
MEQDSPPELQSSSRSPPPKPRVIRQRSSEDRTSGGAATPSGRPFMYRSLTEPAGTGAAAATVANDDDDPNDDNDDHEDDELMTTNAGKFATTALTCTVSGANNPATLEKEYVPFSCSLTPLGVWCSSDLLRNVHTSDKLVQTSGVSQQAGNLTVFSAPSLSFFWFAQIHSAATAINPCTRPPATKARSFNARTSVAATGQVRRRQLLLLLLLTFLLCLLCLLSVLGILFVQPALSQAYVHLHPPVA